MLCPDGGGRTLSQFALVCYLPEPLAGFLDRLRLELNPGYNPHAHVTVLPPRPVTSAIREVMDQLTGECGLVPPFEVLLGDVEVFPVSNVIYMGIAQGAEELRQLHGQLDTGLLQHCCPFPFHPHITIAQDLLPGRVQELARRARESWSRYDGPRSFCVESLSFVQNVAPGVWTDIAPVSLAVPVSAAR